MTYRFMRKVDESLGNFLCVILGIVVRLKRLLLPPRLKERGEVRSILVQKYFGMGSILHSAGLIRILRNNYPRAKITFLTIETNRELITLCALADEVLTVDFSAPGRFVKSFLKITGTLWGRGFDLSVDLEFFACFPLLVSVISRAPERVGLFHRKMRPAGIITKTVRFNFYRHISEIYRSYADVLEIPRSSGVPLVHLPSFRAEMEDTLRTRFGLNRQERIITVNVNSGDLFSFRKWPARNFAALLNMLLERHPCYAFVLIGSSSERQYVDDIIRMAGIRSGRVVNCAGQTSLKELFTLIEIADLVITNDSGPLHIASLYGKNLAAFFGPETPVVYGPLNSNALVFYPDSIYCSPCLCVYDSKQSLYAETCEENICLASIAPNHVLEALENRFLGSPAPVP